MHKTTEFDAIFNMRMKDIAATKPLSRAEEEALFKKYHEVTSIHDKEKIRNTIVQSNLRFVLKVARQYRNVVGADLNELISEGEIGLIMAVDKFKPQMGNKFISFAVWWIKCYITKYLDQNDLIRIPSHQKYKLNKLRKENSSDLDTDDLMLLELSRSHISIDTPIGSTEDDLYLKDILKDDNALNGEQMWIKDRSKNDLINIIERVLTEEEQIIIKELFGLHHIHEATLDDTQELIGKSKERIRQIRNRALNKLKNNKEVRELNKLLNTVHG